MYESQIGQEVQVRISDVNTDNNTVNLSMVAAGAYDDRSGGGYGKRSIKVSVEAYILVVISWKLFIVFGSKAGICDRVVFRFSPR